MTTVNTNLAGKTPQPAALFPLPDLPEHPGDKIATLRSQ